MSPDPITRSFPAMGGSVDMQIVRGSTAGASAIEALFASHERAMSRFDPESELCALNTAAPAPFRASPLLFDAVSEAVGWACITEGIFDPTVLDALEASGYDRSFEQISPRGGTAVASRPPARTQQLWRQIALDYDHETITLPADARIDLGGIGKGYTVDRAIASLGSHANAMVNASGDLYAAGDGPDGDGWYVGVQDPFLPEQDLVVLNVNDRGVGTSGSSKRHWNIGDTRYHHLIDPRERASSGSDLLTVTVVGLTATQADVLAKCAFLLGSAAGITMIERFDGAECIAVTARGETLATSGMAEYFA